MNARFQFLSLRLTLMSVVYALNVAGYSSERIDSSLTYELEEESPRGTVVTSDLIRDSNLSRKFPHDTVSALKFVFLDKTHPYLGLFALAESSGVLATAGVVDRESVCGGRGDRFLAEGEDCILALEVAVKSQKNYFHIIKVKVVVTDINDNAPVFPATRVVRPLPESTTWPTKLFPLASASDLDGRGYGVSGYQLVTDAPEKFALESESVDENNFDLRLVLNGELDREEKDMYLLKLIAFDGGNPRRSATMTIDLRIVDANDNSPKFTRDVYNASVPENSERGSVVVVVSASDADEGQNGRVRYEISKNSEARYSGMFQMNWETGALSLYGRLDREHQATYFVTISATDSGDNPVPTQATVIITVTDVNDNRPEISIEYFTDGDQLTVSERADPGALVASVTVSDNDEGDSGRVECSLSDNNSGGLTLATAQASGNEIRILTARRFDKRVENSVNATILCHDFGQPQMTSMFNLSVLIVEADDDDRRPQFTQAIYRASLVENNPPGAFVVNVSLVGTDIWGFSLPPSVAGSFRIEPKTGVITATRSFDREEADCLEFNVTAEDEDTASQVSVLGTSAARASAPRASALVRVFIVDVDDESPKFNLTVSYEFEVSEDVPVGTQVGRVEATDRDLYPFNETWYALDRSSQDGLGDLEINQATGVIFTRRNLDREVRDRYSVVALAHSRTSGTTTCDSVRVSVLVLDSNDNRPVIAYPTSLNDTLAVPPGGSTGKVIGAIIAFDSDAGDNGILRYRFSNQSDYFNVVSETGHVFLKRHPPENSSHLLQVVVTDSGVPALTSSAMLVVLVLDGKAPLTPANTGSFSGVFRQDLALVFAGIVVGCVLLLTAVVAICIHLKRRFGIRRRRRNKVDRRTEAIWSVVRALSTGQGTADNNEAPTDSSTASRTIPKLDFEPVNFKFRHRWTPASDGDSGLDLMTISATSQGSCVDDDSELSDRRKEATTRSVPSVSETPNHLHRTDHSLRKSKKDEFPFPPPPPVSLPYAPYREFYVSERQQDEGTSSFRPHRLPRSCSVDCDAYLSSTMPPEDRQSCFQQRPLVLPSLFQGRGRCYDVPEAETRLSLPRSASYGSRKSVRFAAEDL